MVFLRHKIIKGNSYTYLVENKWNPEKKSPTQRTVKYLGKTSNIVLSDIPHQYRNSSSVITFLGSEKNTQLVDRQRHLRKLKKDFFEYLIHGEIDKVQTIYKNFTKQATLSDFYEDILRPVLYTIGDMWDLKKLDVGEEHIASNTVVRLLELIKKETRSRPNNGKSILICTPYSENHVIPCLMLETFLSIRGYTVINLAPSVPVKSILNQIETKKPDLVLMSITLYEHLESGKQLISKIKKLKIPILLGGQATMDTAKISGVAYVESDSLQKISQLVKQVLK
jgi:methanogenic corrinoid protein MtbC1